MPAILAAIRTLDCANKVRIHYLLAQSITPELLTQFPATIVDINEFSKIVNGAKDHFSLTQGQYLRATGIIGETKLVVTYGKTQDNNVDRNISIFEDQIRNINIILK